MNALLDIQDLTVEYDRHRVLDGVSLAVRAGEILGIIGETGSGKTTLARAVAGLAPVRGGRIAFDGAELTALRGRALRAWRRTGALQYIFQDPLRALDPQHTVAAAVGEGLAVAGGRRPGEIAEQVAAALTRVGLDPALASRRPGEISGGQRQRVLLARALAVGPRLLLCDEPVSALDASNRNHVLRLLAGLRNTAGVSVVVITHDLSSLAGIADRVAVLYGGRLVEHGPIQDVLTAPRHPYTALLAASSPSVRREHPVPAARLRGTGDGMTHPGGCVYAVRCPFATAECATAPELSSVDGDRAVACHHAGTWRARLGAGAGDLAEVPA
ncbi:ABC transporter ATP-binding protein [Dactylosporangium sp. NPDC051484]|uniref:ABC transporter ATP-binding protein n=1 Tax=Dactylosporangium sp. NPDC051484 TaxID=3154942 RepID=UPI003450B80F